MADVSCAISTSDADAVACGTAVCCTRVGGAVLVRSELLAAAELAEAAAAGAESASVDAPDVEAAGEDPDDAFDPATDAELEPSEAGTRVILSPSVGWPR